MSSVHWHTMMSLDGYIAGTGNAMEWAFEHGGRSAMADDAREVTGAILAGRGWYDVATERYDGVAGIYGGAWDGPVFVLTHRPGDLAADGSVTAVSGTIEQAVGSARAEAAPDSVGIFGADVARQCLDAGLVDEIVVHIAPVLLGDGVRLYGDGAPRVGLERIAVEPAEQVIGVRFRVRRRSA